MRENTTVRVQKHRTSLRSMGMRPIQIWVPDTRLASFADESKRQSLVAAAADVKDQSLMSFLDDTLADIV
jgi:hypothetical protein